MDYVDLCEALRRSDALVQHAMLSLEQFQKDEVMQVDIRPKQSCKGLRRRIYKPIVLNQDE